MSCKNCLASHWADWGLECRRNPPQVQRVEWTGEACGKKEDKASPAEGADKRNYRVFSVFPVVDPDDHCSSFIQGL